MNDPERLQQKKRMSAVGLSLGLGASLMAAKFYAYRITGSSAILSDALESIINVVASAFALWSVSLSAKPPDDTHPYGHGKIEYFSAGFEGALIVLAALGIFANALSHTVHPRELLNLNAGLLVLIGTGLANLLLGLELMRVGRRTGSLIVTADGKHVMADVYTTGGVLAGLILVLWTGWLWLDGAIACLVGLNIIFSGWKLLRKSWAGLMDESDPELLEKICAILMKHRKDIWIDIHKLRAWRSGWRIHVDFHLILPRRLSLEESHREIKELEFLLKKHLGDQTDVLIHPDPCIDPECSVCNFDACGSRRHAPHRQGLWRREEVVSEARVANRPVVTKYGPE